MTYLDYFKTTFKRSFFLYSIMLAFYLMVCLFSETVRSNLVDSVLVTATGVFIGVLLKAFMSYKKKESIKDVFDW